MRLRFGVVFCLVAVVLGMGCRKPLNPNIDRNMAPETWITAAPMDTLTPRDPNGRPLPIDPTVHFIPVRFHMYWAGADADGAVVGYYYAVTETTTTRDPGSGLLPDVPGPKPQDYHYTTRTDTTFIFNVMEGSPDRQHAFFIYAVDNQGKADPTPARFMFTAIDNFRPTPIFDIARATGTVYTIEAGQLVSHPDIKDITDIETRAHLPRDTAAVNSVLFYKWHAQLGIAGTFVKKYCWRLEETTFNCSTTVPPQDTVTYSGPFAAGRKTFTLEAVDQAGGANDSTRRVILNYMPDTWFSGPNPTDPQFVQTYDQTGDRYYVDLRGQTQAQFAAWPGITGTLMSGDSLKVLPISRPQRKTFMEIWNGRIYAHSEGDTVHMNSWVVFMNGGYDKDSQYKVRVDYSDPWLRPLFPDTAQYPVILRRPERGSPVGFRSQVIISTDPTGSQTNFAQTGLYPVYEPASVFRATNLNGYWPMFLSGKAYAVARAEDGDGQTDDKVGDQHSLADLVDANGGTGGTPEERALRQREVMTFYVNKSPFFDLTDPAFVPAPDGTTQFFGISWNLYLPSDDVDPYDPATANKPVGVPTASKPLRYRISIFGKDLTGHDLEYDYDPGGQYAPYFFNTFNVTLNVPPELDSGPVKIRVQLCDCVECERLGGQGRCIVKDFDATYFRTAPTAPGASVSPDRGGSR